MKISELLRKIQNPEEVKLDSKKSDNEKTERQETDILGMFEDNETGNNLYNALNQQINETRLLY